LNARLLGPARASDAALSPIVSVAGDPCALVVGGACVGIRVDLRGSAAPFDPALLLFELAIDPALPLRLAELRRLYRLCRGAPMSARPQSATIARDLLLLRTIDALGEGASLRMIGEALVRADDWPGAGESTKSRARRLVAGARAMWAGGAKKSLLGTT